MVVNGQLVVLGNTTANVFVSNSTASLSYQLPTLGQVELLVDNASSELQTQISNLSSQTEASLSNLTSANGVISNLTAGTLLVTGNELIDGNLQVIQDVTITGNLNVNGTSSIVNAQQVETTSAIIIVNEGDTGAGVTNGTAGILVDRGTLPNYYLVFDEANGDFSIGEVGTALQPVATREVTPVADGFAYWNSTAYTYVTNANITFDATNGVISSAANAVSSTDVPNLGQVETLISNASSALSTSISNTNSTLQSEINTNTTSIQTNAGNIANLSSDVTAINANITNLSSDVATLDTDVSNLSSSVAQLQTTVGSGITYTYTATASGTSFVVTHNLNKQYVLVQVYDSSNGNLIIPDQVNATNTSSCTVTFAQAITPVIVVTV
jgi:hypothetical protein